MTSLGTDGDWLLGPVTSRVTWATGRVALAKSLARRLMQPNSSLPYWPGYGENLGALLGANVSMGEVRRRVERQFAMDERVRSAEVIATQSNGAITLYCVIEDEDGPFEFVMSTTEASTKLVSLQGQAVS